MKRADINLQYWLVNEDTPPLGGQPDQPAGGPPITSPGGPGDPMGNQVPPPAPAQGQTGSQDGSEDDIAGDPQGPDMPEDQEEEQDFEEWKIKFVEESKKADPYKMEQLLLSMRNQDLDANPRKFVEDNLQIAWLRQSPLIFDASRKIRKLMQEDLDRNLPSTSIANHIASALQEIPVINEIFIKLVGGSGGKQDWYRKLIAGLLGAVQVGVGANKEDLVIQNDEDSVRLSTRFNTRWGNVFLGSWSMMEDDAERWLKGPELERLEAGSPEERDVLRRRVVIQSICDMFKERAFLVTTVGTDGTVHHLGLDLGNLLEAAYTDGRIIVRSEHSDAQEAFIDDEGAIVAIPQLSIYYVRESDRTGNDGEPMTEEIAFIDHREGALWLVAQADLLIEASSTLQQSGLVMKEVPWTGNPTDYLRLTRCVPSVDEILLKRC